MISAWADPTGPFITYLRNAPSVHALVGDRVRGFDPDDIDHDTSPIVLIRNYSDAADWGLSVSRQTGVYVARVIASCYAKRSRTGRQDARAIALAVAGSVDGRSIPASGNRPLVARMLVESIGGPLLDPDTKEPYVSVIVALIAPAQVGA